MTLSRPSISLFTLLLSTAIAFVPSNSLGGPKEPSSSLNMADQATTLSHLFEPKERDAFFGRNENNDLNVAQYLLDLDSAHSTFDFCGGMLFQLVLTDALKEHLKKTASRKPVIFDASKSRMSQIPNYSKTAEGDNSQIFHGREIRDVPDAAGGMGMVLQLSLANAEDPEGWTPQEQARYDGWGHDSGREWRRGAQLEDEGFSNFREKFGQSAYSLHHRFYLHYDRDSRMWLSAEDGCEGTPATGRRRPLFNLFGF